MNGTPVYRKSPLAGTDGCKRALPDSTGAPNASQLRETQAAGGCPSTVAGSIARSSVL